LITANGETTLVAGERVMHLRQRVDAGVRAAYDLLVQLNGTGGADE
jgi:hypothetical protein